MNPYRYLAGLFAEFRDISAVPSAVRSNVLKAEEESERFAALVVEPQQVVLGEAEAADRRIAF
jgi:hypothetical protein